MQRYRVWMSTVPAMGSEYYDGKVDVEADGYDDAVDKAIWKARRVHPGREFKIKNVEVRR